MFSFKKLFGFGKKPSVKKKKTVVGITSLAVARSFHDSYWVVIIEPHEVLTIPVSMIKCGEKALKDVRDNILNMNPKIEDIHFDPRYQPYSVFVLKSGELKARKSGTNHVDFPEIHLLDDLWIDDKFRSYRNNILKVLSGKK